MAPTQVLYEAEDWGVGELWLDGDRVIEHDLPRLNRPANNPQVASRVPGTLEAGRGFVTKHALAGRLEAYFAGDAVVFADVEVALDDATAFQRALAGALR